jgi:hypothetical protein
LSNSGLPVAAINRAGSYRPETQAAIEAERQYLASLTENNVIQIGGQAPRSPQITGVRTGLDQLTLAFEAMMEGRRPADGIRPLSGIREFYHLLSGDYEMTGMFQPERVQFANVDQFDPWRTWRPTC